MTQIKVWDLFVRSFHWLLVIAIVLNGFILEKGSELHELIGEAVCVLIVLRIIWGFVGSYHARFANFVPSPKRFFAYVGELRRGNHPFHEGHNPAGGAMVILLMVMVVVVAFSGWISTLVPRGYRHDLHELHEFTANALLWLAGIHALAVLWASHASRENLIGAMITGRKRPPES